MNKGFQCLELLHHQILIDKILIQEWPVPISADVVTYPNSDLSLLELIEKLTNGCITLSNQEK
jgi:hypothetical protein